MNVIASRAQQRRWARPEEREKISAAAKRRYARPGEREKMGAIISAALSNNPKVSAAARRRFENPAEREKIKRLWEDSAYRAKICAALKVPHTITPAGRAIRSAAQKRRAATPEGRAHLLRISKLGCTLGTLACARNRPSSLERAFMQMLDAWGAEYVHQKRIGPYAVDFYLPSEHLVVEVDGKYWHSRPEQRERDEKRDAYLQKHGYKVVRLPESLLKDYKLRA